MNHAGRRFNSPIALDARPPLPPGLWGAKPPAGVALADIPDRIIAFVIDAIILGVIGFIVSTLMLSVLGDNYGVFGIGTLSTLRSWLSMWSLRTSQATAAPHLARITVPSLVIHASADACVYESDARALLAAIGAADKRLEFIKADHYLLEPDGARTQAADLIAAWVAEH